MNPKKLLEDAIQFKKELQAEEITIKLGVATEEDIKEMEEVFEKVRHINDTSVYFFLHTRKINFITEVFVEPEVKKANRIARLETELALLKGEGVAIG